MKSLPIPLRLCIVNVERTYRLCVMDCYFHRWEHTKNPHRNVLQIVHGFDVLLIDVSVWIKSGWEFACVS